MKHLQSTKKSKTVKLSRTAVIYTRVASTEQEEKNKSIERQKKVCKDFAKAHKLKVHGFFGGIYDAGSEKERKELNRMIQFAEKNEIGYVLVYDMSRIMRSHETGISVIRRLKAACIGIISVTNPFDSMAYIIQDILNSI